jgi:hypothetical protein
MICGESRTRVAGGEAPQCWPLNYSSVLGFRVLRALVVCIIVPTLGQKMVIVVSLCVKKRILSPCSLGLHGQRNLIQARVNFPFLISVMIADTLQ